MSNLIHIDTFPKYLQFEFCLTTPPQKEIPLMAMNAYLHIKAFEKLYVFQSKYKETGHAGFNSLEKNWAGPLLLYEEPAEVIKKSS